MPHWINQPRQPNLSKTASGKTGAVQASAQLAVKRAEVDRLKQQLSKLVDALADGAPVHSVKDRMAELEGRKLKRNHPAIPTFPFPVKRLSSVLMDDLKGAHKYGG